MDRTPLRTFSQRLAKLLTADLTTADIAHWLGRPYPTVRAWLHLGHEPRGPNAKIVLARTALLERAVKQRTGFPVPYDIRAQHRPAYIVQIRNELERPSVPESRAP